MCMVFYHSLDCKRICAKLNTLVAFFFTVRSDYRERIPGKSSTVKVRDVFVLRSSFRLGCLNFRNNVFILYIKCVFPFYLKVKLEIENYNTNLGFIHNVIHIFE